MGPAEILEEAGEYCTDEDYDDNCLLEEQSLSVPMEYEGSVQRGNDLRDQELRVQCDMIHTNESRDAKVTTGTASIIDTLFMNGEPAEVMTAVVAQVIDQQTGSAHEHTVHDYDLPANGEESFFTT